MIYLFIHEIEEDKEYLKDIYIASWHTHYVMDEYGKIIYVSDAKGVQERVKWLENLGVPKYEHRK